MTGWVPRILGVGVVALLVSSLGGCAYLSTKDDFAEQQKMFTQYVRFGDIEKASHYVVPEQRDDFLQMAPDASKFRFTSYEISELQWGADGSVEVNVRYTGYAMSWPVETSFRTSQHWDRDDHGAWKVHVDLDAFRKALRVAQK